MEVDMNRWKAFVWMAAGLLAALLIIGGLVSIPAVAQAVRAALVRDVDNPALEPVRTPFVVGLQPNEGVKVVDGLIVPAGKRLVIENASVWTFTTGADRITGVWLRPKVNNQLVYILLDPAASEFRTISGGATVAAYNRPLRVYFNPGEQLTVEVYADGSSNFKSANVYLQGYYVTLP
jgi:hypothetical protein